MTKRTPIGLHKVLVTEVNMHGAEAHVQVVRTVYVRLDRSNQIYYKGLWIPAVYTGDDDIGSTYSASYVHRNHLVNRV